MGLGSSHFQTYVFLGVKTLTPPQSSTRNQTPVADKPGRPKVQHTLHFPGSVWETTDHHHVSIKSSQSNKLSETSDDSKLLDLKKENELLKSKHLRFKNIKDNEDKFQFYTNILSYAVFSALCNYIKSRTQPTDVNYWRGKSTGTCILTESQAAGTRGP